MNIECNKDVGLSTWPHQGSTVSRVPLTTLIWNVVPEIPAFPPFTDDLGNPTEAETVPAAYEDAHA